MNAFRSSRKFYVVWTVAAAALLDAGCTSIKTAAYPSALAGHDALERDGRGIVYFLPKRQVEVEVKRTIVKAKDLSKKLTAARTALNVAATAEKEAKDAEKLAKANYDQARNQTDLTDEAKEEFKKKWQVAKVKTITATKAKTVAATALQRIEQAVASSGIDSECVIPSYTVKLTLLAPEPDTRFAFRAKLAHSPWRDDETVVTTTANGLLSSANSTTTDRTGEILVELAKAVSFFTSGGLASLDAFQKSDDQVDQCPTKKTHPPFVVKDVFDPASFEDTFEELETSGTPIERLNRNLLLLNTPFWVVVEKSHAQWSVASAQDFIKMPQSTGKAAGETHDRLPGLVYRRPIPYTVSLVEKHKIDGGDEVLVPKETVIAMAPNEGPIGLIPYKAGPFVKTVNNVAFENGMLTSVDSTQPAELLAAVRLPLQIVDGVASSISKIIPFRLEQAQSEATLLATSKQILETEQAIATLQNPDALPNVVAQTQRELELLKVQAELEALQDQLAAQGDSENIDNVIEAMQQENQLLDLQYKQLELQENIEALLDD